MSGAEVFRKKDIMNSSSPGVHYLAKVSAAISTGRPVMPTELLRILNSCIIISSKRDNSPHK
jgi:hypothetical protein